MKNIEKNILEAFQSSIMERLGECYCQNDGYWQSLKKEEVLAGRLKESLTEGQMALVEEYHAAVSATTGICEQLAYRQGMRDMAAILYEK